MYNELLINMSDYYCQDPKRIHHFIKVFSFANLIAQEEKISQKDLNVLCIAAIVHDIGIKKAEQDYGRCDGKLQEKIGPYIAQEMLEKLGYEKDIIDRVCFLVGHHHTYNNINGIDYQILIEADFIVNAYEDEFSEEAVAYAFKKIFKTNSGKKLLENMYIKCKKTLL